MYMKKHEIKPIIFMCFTPVIVFLLLREKTHYYFYDW